MARNIRYMSISCFLLFFISLVMSFIVSLLSDSEVDSVMVCIKSSTNEQGKSEYNQVSWVIGDDARDGADDIKKSFAEFRLEALAGIASILHISLVVSRSPFKPCITHHDPSLSILVSFLAIPF